MRWAAWLQGIRKPNGIRSDDAKLSTKDAHLLGSGLHPPVHGCFTSANSQLRDQKNKQGYRPKLILALSRYQDLFIIRITDESHSRNLT